MTTSCPPLQVRHARLKRFLLFSLALSLPGVLTLPYPWDWLTKAGSSCAPRSPTACFVALGQHATAEAQGGLSTFTNLQVLPDDIPKEELIRTMKLITKSLGTKCNFCHRTDIRDYASDELKEKVVARKMMQMVQRINRDLFSWKDAPKATCFMCHHGRRKPQLQP